MNESLAAVVCACERNRSNAVLSDLRLFVSWVHRTGHHMRNTGHHSKWLLGASRRSESGWWPRRLVLISLSLRLMCVCLCLPPVTSTQHVSCSDEHRSFPYDNLFYSCRLFFSRTEMRFISSRTYHDTLGIALKFLPKAPYL
jgi:hypothetical protein